MWRTYCRRRQPFFERRCLRVWTTLHRGCAAIDSSSTPRRQVLWCATSRRQHQEKRPATGSHTLRQRFCPDCRLGTQPGHLPGFRGFHEDSCFQTSVQLLQCAASAPVYSVIRHATGPTVVSRVIGAVTTRLRKRDPRWSPGR